MRCTASVPARGRSTFRGIRFLNHRWDLPDTLRRIGRIDESRIDAITGGLFRETVDVDINRAVFDYDLLLILGPVFPHEVAGFSGGHKYLFPGISGRRLPALLPLAGRCQHLLEDHRRQGHSRARGHGRGCCHGPRGPALHRHGGEPVRRPRRALRRGPARGMVPRRGPLRARAHRVRREALPHRAGDRPRDVRRAVDGGQGDVQAGARRGRRWPARSSSLRMSRRSPAPGARSCGGSATTCATTSSPGCRSSTGFPGECSPTPRTCAAWAPSSTEWRSPAST